jgi:hypothetical protein
VDATNWSGFTPGSGGAAAAIQGKRSRPTFLFDDTGLNTEKHGNGMHGDGPGAVQLSELIQVRQKLPGSLLFFHRPGGEIQGIPPFHSPCKCMTIIEMGPLFGVSAGSAMIHLVIIDII